VWEITQSRAGGREYGRIPIPGFGYNSLIVYNIR
jgi:hypothetical protein